MTATLAGARCVEHVMGTVFSIDVRTAGDWDEAFAQIRAHLHEVDRVFSTYRADSDISRIQRRELRPADAHPWVPEVLELCDRAQRTTGGWFAAIRGGRLDPTGLVKGWAVQRAAAVLTDHGSRRHLVNGGGDVLAVGGRPDGPWRLGVVDPHASGRLLASIEAVDLAVATSGTTERGLHVEDPFTGRPATGTAAVTVVGPSITAADAYATAALARGDVGWLDDVDGHEAMLVAADGTQRVTRHWDRYAREVPRQS